MGWGEESLHTVSARWPRQPALVQLHARRNTGASIQMTAPGRTVTVRGSGQASLLLQG